MITLKNLCRTSAVTIHHKILSINLLQKLCTKSKGSGDNDGNSQNLSDNVATETKSKIEEHSDKKQHKKEAISKLNALLKQMLEEDVHKNETKLDLAKPKPKRKARDAEKSKEFNESNVVKAAKDVSKELGDNTRQTESELLGKLLSNSGNNQQKPSLNLSDLVRGMKIDKESNKKPEGVSRAKQVRMLIDRANGRRQEVNEMYVGPKKFARREQLYAPVEVKRIDLFGAEPLGIFQSEDCPKPVENTNKTWQTLFERDLRLAVTHPPANYFQEMILWTEQGKLWKFPIDNEQDIGEEDNIYFIEHVFLEKHLESWCPQKGPIRHFMELVCVGLSKNHYLTVNEKREHIEWYKDYFKEKSKLLTEVGALPPGHKFQEQIDDK